MTSLYLRSCSFCLLLFALTVYPAWGGSKAYTWFLDGVRVELEVDLASGVIDIPLPTAVQEGSFRVKPLGNGRIESVEIVPVKPDRAVEKELAVIADKRDALNDRLSALEVKEEIYKAAAKSQGGKAPKRTRTNPEPLSAIRQGTDFAFARLEEVYKARRQTEKAIKELDNRKKALEKQENAIGSIAKVRFSTKTGKLQASYLMTGEGWNPLYDLRISGDKAELFLFAEVPRFEKGATTLVSSLGLKDGSKESAQPVAAGSSHKIASYILPVVLQKKENGVQTVLALSIKNESGAFLPQGRVSGFLNEEYLGKTVFPGRKPGEIIEMTFGK